MNYEVYPLKALEKGLGSFSLDRGWLLRPATHTDFLPIDFGKIQIFFLKIWQNTYFFQEGEGSLYIFFSHTDFPPKILISLVIFILILC